MAKILCIIDGMTDSGFFPKNYRNLSQMEFFGWEDTASGRTPETLPCVLHLLGIKKIPYYLRGYLEALGAGIPVEKEDLILRGSRYFLDENHVPSRPCNEEFQMEIEGGRYYPLEGYQSLFVFLKGAPLVEKIQTFGPHEIKGRKVEELQPTGHLLLEKVFQKGMQKDSCILLWGESVATSPPKRYKNWGMVTGKNLLKGMGKWLEMEVASLEGATGDTDTDLEEKGKKALELAERFPFVLLHINGADEASHRRNFKEKEEFLQKIDQQVLKKLLESKHEILVTSDHGTDPKTGEHLGDLQPMYKKRDRP